MISNQSSRVKHTNCWKKRSKLEKYLMAALSILALITIAIIAIQLVSSRKGGELCLKPECVRTAAEILAKVDFGVDPCQDFYNFACGRFKKETFLPDYSSSITAFTIVSDLLEKQLRTLLAEPITKNDTKASRLVKSYYQACMNTTDIQQNSIRRLKEILRGTGGWPVLEGVRWDDKNFDWKTTLYNFRKTGFDVNMLFEYFVETDSKNSSRKLIYLNQPEVAFEKLMLKGFQEKIVKDYYNYIVKLVRHLGADERRAVNEIRQMIEFNIELARILVPQEERRNSTLEYNPMTIQELEQAYSYVPWLQFLNNMIYPVKQMGYNDTVIVTVPSYFTKLRNLLKTTPKKTLLNFLYWSAMKNLIKYISDDVRNLKLEFLKIASGNSELEPRWQECSTEASLLQAASGSLYVRHFFKQEAKQKMLEMVENIRNQFIDTLKNIDWMDDITRENAIDKAKAIHVHIAYPDEIIDDKTVDDYYRNLTINANNYLEAFLNIALFDYDLISQQLVKPSDQNDWTQHIYTTQVNAYYQQNLNSIELPAGILQGAFFNNDRPNYMNYAGIGFIIGHEITHGFDDQGRQFDKNGNLKSWWQPKTEQAFNNKAQCIIDQYSNFTVPKTNININGINTQGENIADNGGIKQAYLAYKTWAKSSGPDPVLPGLPYSPEQLFWISLGNSWCSVERSKQLKIDLLDNEHAPDYYRVNVPLMNNEDFARDFNCPVGARMNPAEKCTVW